MNAEESLRTPASNGDEEAVSSLIARGVDVNATSEGGRTALMQAAKRGHATTVELLLGHDADVRARNRRGKSALTYAVEGERLGVAQALLERGADPNEREYYLSGWTLLMAAPSSGHTSAVRFLLGQGADVEARDLWRATLR
jgi:ankyrin repeat protein